MLQSALNWAPGVISIAFAISVALAIRFARLRPEVVTLLSLVFEVVSSYGIAAAEFLQPLGLNTPSWIGLSWVAVWMLLGDYSRVFSNGSSGPPAEATLNPVVVERPRAPEARVVCCAGSATGALR